MKKTTRIYLLCVLLLLTTTACENKKAELSENTVATKETATSASIETTSAPSIESTPAPNIEATSVPTMESTATQDMESTPDTEETHELNFEQYGSVKEVEKTFYSHKDKEQEVYHYIIEQFFFDKKYAYAETVNSTLSGIYEDYVVSEDEFGEERRNNTAEDYKSGMGVEEGKLLFSKLTYADEKYISICFCDVSYMGGAHPYTYQVSYTIDAQTGEILDAEDILGKSKEDIIAENPELQSWEDSSEEIYGYGSYYLTKDNLVFYRGFLNTEYEEVCVKYEGE